MRSKAKIKSVALPNGRALKVQIVDLSDERALLLEVDAAGQVKRTIADCPKAYVEPALALIANEASAAPRRAAKRRARPQSK